MAKRRIESTVTENEMNASTSARSSKEPSDTSGDHGEGTSWGTVNGADDVEVRGGNHHPGSDEPRSDIEAAAEALVNKAQQVIETGLEKLDPQMVQWGQSMIGSFALVAAPVRRSFKTQPLLTGAGVGAIAVGGVLLALAITRDRSPLKPRPRAVARNN